VVAALSAAVAYWIEHYTIVTIYFALLQLPIFQYFSTILAEKESNQNMMTF
jgi:hypothetical protein